MCETELAGNLYFKYISKGFGFWNEIELAKSFALLLWHFFIYLLENKFRTRILNSILDAAWRGWSNHLSRVLCRNWELSPCNSSGKKWWLPGFRIISSVISTNISIHLEHVPYYLHVFSEVPAQFVHGWGSRYTVCNGSVAAVPMGGTGGRDCQEVTGTHGRCSFINKAKKGLFQKIISKSDCWAMWHSTSEENTLLELHKSFLLPYIWQ